MILRGAAPAIDGFATDILIVGEGNDIDTGHEHEKDSR